MYFKIYHITVGDHIEMLDVTVGNLSALLSMDEENSW